MLTFGKFLFNKIMQQPRCPLTDEWIKRSYHIYVMEYYLAIKRNEFASVPVRWIKLELVIQSEVSQKEKNRHHVIIIYMEYRKNGMMNLFVGQQ